MSEPEDERLRAARIKAALAFFGPKQATMRAALEGAGFKVSRRITQDDWIMGPTVSQSWPDRYGATNPKLGGLRFHARFTATRCRFWLLGLPEEWEVSEGAYERARGLLLSGPEGVSLMLAVRAEAAEARIAELEAEQ